jgi:cell division protein FtsB
LRPPLVHRVLFALLPAALLSGLFATVVWGEKGLIRHAELRTELRDANNALRHLERKNQRLLRELHALDEDRIVVERVVAEDLGWASAGTTLYHFSEPHRP